METVDSKDIKRDVNYLLQINSSCQTDGSAIRDCEEQEQSDQLVKVNDIEAIGEERTEAEPPFVSMYRY